MTEHGHNWVSSAWQTAGDASPFSHDVQALPSSASAFGHRWKYYREILLLSLWGSKAPIRAALGSSGVDTNP